MAGKISAAGEILKYATMAPLSKWGFSPFSGNANGNLKNKILKKFPPLS